MFQISIVVLVHLDVLHVHQVPRAMILLKTHNPVQLVTTGLEPIV